MYENPRWFKIVPFFFFLNARIIHLVLFRFSIALSVAIKRIIDARQARFFRGLQFYKRLGLVDDLSRRISRGNQRWKKKSQTIWDNMSVISIKYYDIKYSQNVSNTNSGDSRCTRMFNFIPARCFGYYCCRCASSIYNLSHTISNHLVIIRVITNYFADIH